jgi:hypothetical protein
MTSFRNKVLFTAVVSILAGCGGGDINISPVTQDTSVDNSVNNSNNTSATSSTAECAFYVTQAGQTIAGTYDGLDCIYAPTFVDAGNNLAVDLTIPDLANGGAHVFQGSLFVGEDYGTNAELTAAGLTKGGDGVKLTIEAGATLAFTSKQQFIIINRGSQIFAAGTALKPITITSLTDIQSQRAAAPTLVFDAVQQWGGLVLNGFGVTNKCPYDGAITATTDTLAMTAAGCNVLAEGAIGLDTSHYGGDNNDDNSGRLEYVRLKHMGAEVASGSELNGISFGAVGRNTTVNNLEIYSSYDDGIEMFGGAVNINNYVAVYVRDDSIDIDEGYRGTITNALVIQAVADGNYCIESDGIGSYNKANVADNARKIAQGINSRPTINNLTCITSANAGGTHEVGRGWKFREGIFPTVNNSMMISAFSTDDPASTNACLDVKDDETLQGAQDGNVSLNSVIFACVDRTFNGPLPNATTTEAWAVANGNQFATTLSNDNVTAASNTALVLLEGTPSIYSVPYATMVVDGAAPTATAPTNGASYIGALSLGATDWTNGWTYGIFSGSRAVDANGADIKLWFE